jgi:signal transduction histidine kinase
MSRMIEQLLDFTRIRTGGFPIQRTPMELAEICQQGVREIEIAQRRCQIALTVVGDTRGFWDPDRLAQVVSNLVGNAARHGEEGLIEVIVDGRQNDEVVFTVHNQGVISPELMPQLFDPFRMGKKIRDGLGLGLYITKQIVEAHGGVLSVCSSASVGTSFSARLPRQMR